MISDSELELVDLLYSVSTRDASLSDAAQSYLWLQNDELGAIFEYDPVLDINENPVVFTAEPSKLAFAQGLIAARSGPDHSPHNPLLSRAYDSLIEGHVMVTDDFYSLDEFSETPYFEEVYVPLGLCRSMLWLTAGRGQKWLMFGTSRGALAGSYSAAQRGLAARFKRHLSRVTHILELLDGAADQHNLLEQSLERLPQSILVVDDDCRIQFCNSSAQRLMQASPALLDVNDRFSVGLTQHDRSKFANWWRLLVSSVDWEEAIFDSVSMAPVWEIEVSRVGMSHVSGMPGRFWMLVLKQVPSDMAQSVDMLRELHGLSKAEARVAVALCHSGDAVSVARAINLSPHTVRTHLKSIFRKTGTRNQVELAVRLTSDGIASG